MLLRSTPGPTFDPWTASRVAQLRSMGTSVQQFVEARYPPVTRFAFWSQIWRYQMLQQKVSQLGIVFVLWPMLTLASLMIFRTSMRQAKINTLHVARCVAYSSTALVIVSLLALLSLFALMFWTSAFRSSNPNWIYFVDENSSSLAMGILLLLTYRLGVAYEKYLRFEQPYLTAMASQVIVGLALWKVTLMLRGM